MSRPYDAIVVGMGVMGAAALRALARRGWNVLGLDRHVPPHKLGASQGKVRVIREAYFESPFYVPLVKRAYHLWDELGREAGKQLLFKTGAVFFGGADGRAVAGTLESAREHGLDCHEQSIDQITERFPMFRPDRNMTTLWEPNSGFVLAEESVQAFLGTAKRHGAELRDNEPVYEWSAKGDGVEVRAEHETYRARHLVLCNGAWMRDLMPEMPIKVERAVQFWFEPAANAGVFVPQLCPITFWEYEKEKFFYTFPMQDGAVKVAAHYGGEITEHPDQLRREVDEADETLLRDLLKRYIPDANGALRSAQACMYANTPDCHFVLDRHPRHERVLMVSACSGHGFKFAPTIGEIVSDLVVEGFTPHDIERFRLDRFKSASA